MALGDIDEKAVVLEEVATHHKVPLEKTPEYKFCTNTTCHGLSHVVEARRTWVRWFWGLTVLVAFTLLIEQVVVLCMQYAQYEAVTEFYVNRTNGLEFPAITICNYNRFKKDAVDEVAKELDVQPDAFWKYLSYAVGVSIPPSSADKLVLKETHANLSRALGGEDKIDVRALVDNTSYTLEDLIPLPYCYWSGSNGGTCKKTMFSPLITSMGKCWSFNFGPGHDLGLLQQLPGSGMALNVLVVLDPRQFSEQLTSGGNSQAGIRVLVHSPSEYPTFETETVAIPTGVYGYIALEASRDIRAKPRWGECGERPLATYPVYKKDACQTEYLLNFIKDTCKCVPIYLAEATIENERICTAIDVVTCSDAAYIKFFNDDMFSQIKDCPLDCDIMRYTSRVSYANNPNILPTAVMDVLAKKKEYDAGEVFRKSMIAVNVYFQRLKVNVMKQKPGKSFESLLADIGGQLGLFVGASVITICEFIEYFIVKCSICWRYHRTKRRMRKERNDTAMVMEATPNSRNGHKVVTMDSNGDNEKGPKDAAKSGTNITFL